MIRVYLAPAAEKNGKSSRRQIRQTVKSTQVVVENVQWLHMAGKEFKYIPKRFKIQLQKGKFRTCLNSFLLLSIVSM